MALRIKEHWFGMLLAFVVLLFLLFIIVVLRAPHNDARMRGFTPCTYAMAEELTQASSARGFGTVAGAVTSGYFCYAKVMAEGVKLWLAGKQSTPWENYLFEAEKFMISPTDSEPFSDDLLNANLLDVEEESTFLQNDIKENVNDKE